MDNNTEILIEKMLNYEYNLGKVVQMEASSKILMDMAKDEYSKSNDELAEKLRKISVDFNKRGEKARGLLNEFIKKDKEMAWSILDKRIEGVEFSDEEMDFIVKSSHMLNLE